MLTALGPPLAAAAVRALGATLRLTEEGVEALQPRWAARQPLIYAVWHGRMLMVPWLNARLRRTRGARSARILASRSRDGELVARWVARFGLPVVRGSSSRDGAPALRALAAAVRAGEDVAVVPDGPRGPRERLQAGLVVLAAATGAPIVPLGFAARPARRLASWDRFLVPWPFARAALVLGKAVTVARHADREAARAELERALREVTETADRLVGA
ncbi:MAG TPA: lysophospholipid acyltransferase family protein [Methylomirabilota bacterium]|nr:lysophospholipid acyltransferase family protein [Methylomirabilota bacterium]